MELDTIRARLTAGLLNKAQRGELALLLPIGLTRDPSGVVLKDPDREVHARLELVFSTFLQVGSANKVLAHFNRNDLRLPRRGHVRTLPRATKLCARTMAWNRPATIAA